MAEKHFCKGLYGEEHFFYPFQLMLHSLINIHSFSGFINLIFRLLRPINSINVLKIHKVLNSKN